MGMSAPFTLLAVVHGGKLAMQAVLLLASIRARDSGRRYNVVLAEPQPGALWPDSQSLDPSTRALLTDLGADIRPFDVQHFGATYPYGHKIEALSVLGAEPFVFLDTDTLVLAPLGDIPFDFTRPMGSLRRTDTWPKPQPGGPDRAAIWASLYRQFDLDFTATQNPDYSASDWHRYLYFNAGFYFHENADVFGAQFLRMATQIRNAPPPELTGQSLDPWLDQVALPLVIASLGGGHATLPPGMIDGSHTCHYRNLALLYAREADPVVDLLEQIAAPNVIKRALKAHKAAHLLIYRGEGRGVRAKMAGLANGPEQPLRQALKAAGYWDL